MTKYHTDAQARIPKKPTLLTKRSTPNLERSSHVLKKRKTFIKGQDIRELIE